MGKQFKGKVVVVTGGAKGMGAATVSEFHRQGASVAILDTDRTGEALAKTLGKRGMFVHCDVSNGHEVRNAFEAIKDRFDGVDVLVNNAGISRYGTVTETGDDEWDLIMNVNLKSAFLCAKQALPMMLERGAGVVINIASVQALQSQARVAAYTASKSGMLGLTRSIAIDYAPNIRCVAVCPGSVDTPMLRTSLLESPDPAAVLRECNEMHLVGRIARPEEIADLTVFLASDKAGFITGQYYRVDGGLGIELAGSKRA